MTNTERYRGELQRVRSGPTPGQRSGGLGTVSFLVQCRQDAPCVLERAKEAFTAVLEAMIDGWLEDNNVSPVLPQWFIDNCGPERTDEELLAIQCWRESLSKKDRHRARLEYKWGISDWLYWFHPENRYWF